MKHLIPVLLLVPGSVLADNSIEPIGPSQSDFGGVGLMQMPTARMAKEGEFSLNLMNADPYRRHSLSLQLFPWMETTIRYTDVRNRQYGPSSFSGNQTYKDKGFDVKFRLLQENYWQPDVSIGFRDIGGTGLFDGEYVAASKKFGPVDLTLGLGVGYLAKSGNTKNPLCSYSEKYCTRSGGYSPNYAGKFNINRFLHGDSSIFGGIEYQTPLHPLRLKMEYDSNNYIGEHAGDLPQKSHFNFGAVYRLADPLDLHLSYQRGNTFVFGITLRTNLSSLPPISQPEPKPVFTPKAERTGSTDWNAVATSLDKNAGWKNPEIWVDDHTVTVLAEQTKYRDPQEGLDRAGILLANSSPDGVREFHLIETRKDMPLKETVIDRAILEKQLSPAALGNDFPKTKELPIEPTAPQGDIIHAGNKEWLSYGVDPVLVQSFGGPEDFYMYQIGLTGNAEAKIGKNWLASGSVYVNLADNYDKFNFRGQPGDGTALPPVRTLIREYVSNNAVRLNNLQLTRVDHLGNGWYSQLYGGYLEMMYAGVGGEVLYRPLNKDWAVGIDMNMVRQRDWRNQFGLLDYSVATGHMTGYARVPGFDNVDASISVGRYLAKDYGITIGLAKEFDSGVRAGLFVTKTNVSSDAYGEGAFTKGFFVSIPFDLMTIRPTKQRASFSWIPLTRDGGQMLSRKYGLHTLTQSREINK